MDTDDAAEAGSATEVMSRLADRSGSPAQGRRGDAKREATGSPHAGTGTKKKNAPVQDDDQQEGGTP